MIDTIYIEDEIYEHARTARICDRYPAAARVRIERYGSVFNPKSQNFRLQKRNPSLILAKKKSELVLPVPDEYTTGGDYHYYFSHMLNCVYDCRYCFLQGMFRSAHFLLFVNYEDFIDSINQVAGKHPGRETWFFSGYDCDSLAFEPLTGFAEHFLPEFARLDNAVLELRTKSTQIRSLLEIDPLPNVVVAYSLNPESVARELEIGAPGLAARIDALGRLQDHGWQTGLRLDPLIWHEGFEASYGGMFDEIFSRLNPDRIHSVTLGSFRLPHAFHKNMQRLYPEHWLLAAGLSRQAGMISYSPNIQQEMLGFCMGRLAGFLAPDRVYQYTVSGQKGHV